MEYQLHQREGNWSDENHSPEALGWESGEGRNAAGEEQEEESKVEHSAGHKGVKHGEH